MSEKIQKILARAGVASRRAAEDLLRANKVTLNGKPAKLGDRATADDIIAVNGKVIDTTVPDRIVLLYHKPEGVLCSRKDDQGERPLIFDQLPNCPEGRWLYVGRLDLNSSGLMLITNDGSLANNLMHPSKHVLRTYRARVIGELPDMAIKRLRQGVQLEDGKAKFNSIKATGHAGGKNRWYEVTIAEGRNRIVRRMFEAVNCTVSRLMRTKLGPIALPRDLPPGASVQLSSQQLQDLLNI